MPDACGADILDVQQVVVIGTEVKNRQKDPFKTSQGKRVALSAIAATFGGICPYISEFVTYGESRPYAVVLAALDPDAIRVWAPQQGLADRSFAESARHEKTRELIGGHVEQLNAQLNRRERIKKFAIVDRELSVESGDLTPSMKLRSRAVVTNFPNRLESMH